MSVEDERIRLAVELAQTRIRIANLQRALIREREARERADRETGTIRGF